MKQSRRRTAVATGLAGLAALALSLGAWAAGRGPEDDPVTAPRPTGLKRPGAGGAGGASGAREREDLRELLDGSTVSVQSYREFDPGKKHTPPNNGGMSGAMERVADQIGSDDREASTGAAVLKLRLVPRTTRKGETFVVRVNAETVAWKTEGTLSDEGRAGVNADRDKVMKALSGWEKTLSAEEAATLRQQGRLAVSLRECFRGTAYLKPVAPVVEALLPDETGVERVEFLVTTKSGVKRMQRLIEGCVTVAEVTFAEPPAPDQETVVVNLGTAAGALALEATRTAAGSAVYWTKAFVPRAADGGLAPPGVPFREGDERLSVP